MEKAPGSEKHFPKTRRKEIAEHDLQSSEFHQRKQRNGGGGEKFEILPEEVEREERKRKEKKKEQ